MELSWAHAIECAQVTQDLEATFGGRLIPNEHQAAHESTCLDVAIGRLKFYEREANKIDAVVRAIEQIRTICAGQKAFYDASEATPAEEWQDIERLVQEADGGEADEEEPLDPEMMATAQAIVLRSHARRQAQQQPRPPRNRYQGGRRRTIPRQEGVG